MTESLLRSTLLVQTTLSEEETMTIELDVQRIYSELSQVRRELGSLKISVDQLGQGIRPKMATAHAHIVRIPGVHGGRPVVRGAGVSVQAIAEQSQLGRSPQQIVEDFEDVLTLAQVYDALSYYYEHQAEIEGFIAQNREALWQGPPVTASS